MTPIIFKWTGVSMEPIRRFREQCDQQFVIGDVYRLIEEEERSQASHGQYFALLTEVWRNLPEDVADRFPTTESLRKWCLIKTGYSDVRSMVYETANDAKKAATLLGAYIEHAVILASGPTVTIYVAKSQSMRAMDKATFQASKTAVLELAASMIGVTVDDLTKQVPKEPRQKAVQGPDDPAPTTEPSAETAPSELLPSVLGTVSPPLRYISVE